jgi:hypothetical protein
LRRFLWVVGANTATAGHHTLSPALQFTVGEKGLATLQVKNAFGLKLIPLTMAASLFLRAFAQTVSVCAACHPGETDRYLQTAMAQSLSRPAPLPAGRVKHQRSGSVIAIEQRGASMIHRLAEHGLTAEYEVAWQIGAGRLAHSYVVEIKGYLFESPASWFRSDGWDVSPGYARAPAVDFDRPINETCLYCHAGPTSFGDADGRRLASSGLTAITCERCHGPSGEHVRNPSAKNIVNPAKLATRARDSVCEQCHLEGVARILNPGKKWQDFQPGRNLEQTAAVYVSERSDDEFRPVSQIEQMASSKCARESQGKLWCGSCHKVHAAQQTDRTREIREVCQSCHPSLSKVTHQELKSDCVNCHMPRLATGYAHVAVTDHRILRRPGNPAGGNGGEPGTLTAWVEPPTEFRQRDLALAELTAGHRLGLPTLQAAGLALLPKLQVAEDAAVLSSACEAMLDRGPVPEAPEVCRRAALKEPESADRAMFLGIALHRAGELAAAERELKNAIRLDPSLKHAYVELWTLYDGEKKKQERDETGSQFLNWNPQNIMFRVLQVPPAPKR